MIDERELTKGKVCARCGAAISSRMPGRSCPACLIESGLGSDDLAEDLRDGAAPLMMNFGDYELLEEIGRGGQGVVFRARQKSLNRIVALKVMGLGHWATEAHIRRFRLEAEAAASLDHPGIVPIYEIGERDGSCYFSMKYIEGGHLDGIAGHQPMPVRRAVELIVKVARTLHYAHQRGILHRDIKPGNILLDAEGEPHLTDFGLARLIESESTITRTMDVLGTPSYIAPEQAAMKPLTNATDVYGLGAVLYQLLTGHPPFAGGTTFETIRLVLETEPRQPRLWNAKVDRDVATICLKCLEKDPQRRYASALELAQDLERWSRYEPIRARRTGLLARGGKWVRRNPALAALVPLSLALATVLAFTFSRSEKQPPPAGIAVLPFENVSGDKDDAVFADGIQDDILTALGKIADLKVISRNSVMKYGGVRDTRKIGQALNVSHVLEGSVRRSSSRVRVNAQLIDARKDEHVWAGQYDRDLTDVFAIQSELAQRIASELSAKITHAEKVAIEAKPTNDLEAYELYLRAKPLTRLSVPDDWEVLPRLASAIDLLEKAVARDPNFALAYCLLTETNLSLYWIPARVDPARRTHAEIALRNAQRIAPEAGETHLAQALFDYYGNRDLDHALEELDTAARLLPNNAEVFDTSARIERRLNRWREALRHFSKAAELDPREPTHLTAIETTYRLLRHYPEAEQTVDRGLVNFPEAADQFWKEKGEAALGEGDLAKARAAIEKLSGKEAFPGLLMRLLLDERNYAEAERVAVAPWNDESSIRFTAWGAILAARAQTDTEKIRVYALKVRRVYEPLLSGPAADPRVLSDVGLIDAALGRKEEAVAECRRAVELRPISSDPVEGPEYVANLALAYAWLGERDHAIEQLSTIANVPSGPSYGDLKLSPQWDSLRDDPRFEKLVAEAAKPLPIQ
jgi:TolB-like protein/Flp pilus assembly protein TadD/predicted Ser/Thr protein kinase